MHHAHIFTSARMFLQLSRIGFVGFSQFKTYGQIPFTWATPWYLATRTKKRAYNFITNKFFAKFGTLKANTLNHAGRLQYIKSVLSSIPIYYMSTVLFSKIFIEKLNAIMRKFWWAGVQEENQTTPIPFRSWDDICKPTQQGGLGVRDLELVNQSLLINFAWNIATDKNPLLSDILKAKYYP